MIAIYYKTGGIISDISERLLIMVFSLIASRKVEAGPPTPLNAIYFNSNVRKSM